MTDAARKITGRLLPAAGVPANLSGAVLEVGSVDGETEERKSCKTIAAGEFSFESKASRIGIYARTQDAKAAAVAIVDRLDRPIELILKPTGEFRGRLLGKEDRPLAGHAVRANVPIIGKSDDAKLLLTRFRAASFEARTDRNGNYSFSGLPCETVIRLFAASHNGSDDEKLLDEIYLVPHESRPCAVSRLWKRQ